MSDKRRVVMLVDYRQEECYERQIAALKAENAKLKAALAHERQVANDMLRSWKVERKSNAEMEARIEELEAALAAKEAK